MTDTIDIFLGDLKCKLQRFRPQPGDIFILTVPEIPFEQEERLRSEWNKLFPETRVLVVVGATVDIDTEVN